MKTKPLLAIFIAILPFATPTALHAKDKASGGAGTVEFSCATWEKLPYPELFYHRGSEYLPLECSAGQRSKDFSIKSIEALELFILKEKVAGAGKSGAPSEYERVGMAPLLKGVSRMLFLIEAKKDANGLPLQLFGMDDTLKAFPAGSFRFMNQTPNLLRIEFGGATHDLPQGVLKIVTPGLPEAGGFLPVIIRNEQGHSILENRFLAQPTGRELVVISPPAEGRTEPVIKFLSDIVPVNLPSAQKPASRK